MRVMVTGSRYWHDAQAIRDDLETLPEGTTIIHGGAKGADSIADDIALELGFQVEVFKANWIGYGRAAGPIRNQEMVDTKPDVVFAYLIEPSKGTAHAIEAATKAGLEVHVREGSLLS